MKNSSPMQVFISFRGDQLRYNFVNHLSEGFKRNGINFFIDNLEQRGKDLSNLFVRIQQSRIALVIFSTRYGETGWCLNELAKIKKLVDEEQLQVIPIFYKVKAQDVRSQTGEFGDNFWKLAKESSGEDIKKWKEALEGISGKMGLSLGDKSYETDFIKEIVIQVKRLIAETRDEEGDNNCGRKRRFVISKLKGVFHGRDQTN